MSTANNSIELKVSDLKPVVASLGKVIHRRPTIPIFEHVKVESVNRRKLRFTGTDGELTFSAQLDAGNVQSPVSFLIPFEHLKSTIQGFGARDVVSLGASRSTCSLDEFPNAPRFRSSAADLDGGLVEGLLQAFECASRDETRYVLRGAFLDVSSAEPAGHRIVATDGRSLFLRNGFSLPTLKHSVILPDHKVWDAPLVKTIEPWSLRLGAKSASGPTPFEVSAPGWSITGNVVEGSFPNYRDVIPPANRFKTRIELDAELILSLVKQIDRLPGKKMAHQPVGLRVERHSLTLLARDDPEQPFSETRIQTASIMGPEVTVFLNREYAKRALSFGLARIEIADESSPVQFVDGSRLMIVMPVRTDTGLPPRTNAVSVQEPQASEAVQRENSVRKKSRVVPETPDSEPDLIKVAATQIAVAKNALKSAVASLGNLSANLKASQRKQRATEKEIDSVRRTIKALKQLEL